MLGKDYIVYGLDIQKPQIGVENFFQVDIRNIFALYWLNFDVVVHLAALVRINESEQNPIEYYNTNVNGTLNILKNVSYKNFIFASTGAAVDCYSPYGVSKRAAEDCVREYCQKNNKDYTIFRFYNVIGSDGIAPTNPDGLMYNLIKSAKTGEFTIHGSDYNTLDGTCVRDYVHVNEICDAIRTAIDQPSNSLENLGHGVGHTVREIIHLFESVNDVTINIQYGPRRKGDLESSVLEKPSHYMKNLYNIKELLKI
jgi:UDP-glucose 4-epimerase